MDTTRRLAGLGLASAAATLALAAPANAVIPPGPASPTGPHSATSTASSSVATVASSTDWAQVGYGAAGGIALAAAGAAGVMLVRRHQHLPHHA